MRRATFLYGAFEAACSSPVVRTGLQIGGKDEISVWPTMPQGTLNQFSQGKRESLGRTFCGLKGVSRSQVNSGGKMAGWLLRQAADKTQERGAASLGSAGEGWGVYLLYSMPLWTVGFFFGFIIVKNISSRGTGSTVGGTTF